MNHTCRYRTIIIRARTRVFAICLCALAFSIPAQANNVRGRVIDAQGLPVAGATALLLKSNGIDSTNVDGNFFITSSSGTPVASTAKSPGTLTFALKNNRLVFENPLRSGFAFELVSLEGRRAYALKRPDLPAGKHAFPCPLDGIPAGLYLAHLRGPGFQISKAIVLLPESRWRYTATSGVRAPLHRESAAVADSLMVFKKGYRSFFIPLQTNDTNLGDLTMRADTAHEEKFVIFLRDSLTAMLPLTSAWEFDPAGKTFANKIAFAPSSWAPDLLLSAETPEYVRQQVNNPTLYDATLYKIDYCTWRVDTVLKSDQIAGLGSTLEKVFLYTDKGRKILDRNTGLMELMESFTLISRFPDLWLVNHSSPDSAYLFSPAENRIKKSLVSSTQFGAQDRYWMSDNGRYMAQSKATGGMLPMNGAVSVTSQIVLFTLDNDSLCRFPINIYSACGSGVPVITYSLFCWFSNNGCFNYVSAVHAGDTLNSPFGDSEMAGRCRLISIQLQTLDTTSSPATAAMFAPRFSPLFMPPYLDSQGKLYDESQVIEMFLDCFGIAANGLDFGLSADGKRFLSRLSTGESSTARTGFIYGDMENRWIERLPDPGPPLTNPFSEIHLYGIADTCD
jgi:hypothetical protein